MNNLHLGLYTALLLLWLSSCSVRPQGAFSSADIPLAPDYSQDRYWASLPWKEDVADLTPDGLENQQDQAEADVFFLHPTTYTGKRGDKNWNGPVREPDINTRTLEGSIQYQASMFNGAGRVFAPYFRQAHLHAYFTKDSLSAQRAFDLAYSDIRNAFRYYLGQHNHGRPIVIAAHSQGTTHAIRLLQEFFDGQELQQQLVAAYLVGIPVLSEYFEELNPCTDASETGCYVSWRTFKRGYEPEETHPAIVVTNPLNWTMEETYAPAEMNKGAVLRPFSKIIPEASDAQVHGPILWASKPKFPGSIFLVSKNYHPGDLNIYYVNIRENAQERVMAFGVEEE